VVLVIKALAVAATTLALAGATAQSPRLAGCPVFPADNPWNQRVDRLPVTGTSAAIIGSIGADTGLHPDFGSGLYDGTTIGIPITVARAGVPKAHVSFDYADESDKGPYPIPANVKIEGGSDRHALILDASSCKLYELYSLQHSGRGWHAGSGAIWSLRSNRVRPAGWTSADAAGLPILPGLVRWSDVAQGHIDHAVRFTVERTRRAYIYPARHYASDLTDANLPPMGLRVRLKANFPIAGFPPQARIVLAALKHYGMIVADNGTSWYITGEPNSHWSNDDLHTLGRVPGSAFEVVDTSSLRPRSK
jgi:hypothetical protein